MNTNLAVKLNIGEQTKELRIKEYNDQRVVTFRDIDELHQRVDGTSRRNFNNNKQHFVKGQDYFHIMPAELRCTNFSQQTNPNGLMVFTESGYLMLVKSFTDDLSWQVQRTLINSYFRLKEIAKQTNDTSITNQFDLMRAFIDKMEQMDTRILQLESKLDKVDTIEQQSAEANKAALTALSLVSEDNINTEGTKRQKLVADIKNYARKKGISIPYAWSAFIREYNTAFNENLKAKITNYINEYGMKINTPGYLEVVDRLDDGLRVSTKMLAKVKFTHF